MKFVRNDAARPEVFHVLAQVQALPTGLQRARSDVLDRIRPFVKLFERAQYDVAFRDRDAVDFLVRDRFQRRATRQYDPDGLDRAFGVAPVDLEVPGRRRQTGRGITRGIEFLLELLPRQIVRRTQFRAGLTATGAHAFRRIHPLDTAILGGCAVPRPEKLSVGESRSGIVTSVWSPGNATSTAESRASSVPPPSRSHSDGPGDEHPFLGR